MCHVLHTRWGGRPCKKRLTENLAKPRLSVPKWHRWCMSLDPSLMEILWSRAGSCKNHCALFGCGSCTAVFLLLQVSGHAIEQLGSVPRVWELSTELLAPAQCSNSHHHTSKTTFFSGSSGEWAIKHCYRSIFCLLWNTSNFWAADAAVTEVFLISYLQDFAHIQQQGHPWKGEGVAAVNTGVWCSESVLSWLLHLPPPLWKIFSDSLLLHPLSLAPDTFTVRLWKLAAMFSQG